MTRKTIYFLILLIPIVFNGCLNYYQETTLKTDGSGKMFIHYWMKTTTAKDSAFVQQVGVFNQDSVKAEFFSKHSTINRVEVFSDSTDTTVHAQIELAFQSIDSLNNTRAFRESAFALKNGATGQKIFSQFIPPVATGFGVNPELFTVTYVYYIPGDIITSNAASQSKNKLTWTYKLSEIGAGKTITVTFRPFRLKETPVWIYFLAGMVLLVVIVFLFRKNKS
ncbi:MAG: hypothetical protein ACM3Q2_10190 [Syntrophothermus sp.]